MAGLSIFVAETSFGAHINGQEVRDMIKTFREVPDIKTADFSTLAAGDYFYYDSIYYMKLIQTYESTEKNLYGGNYYYNSVNIKSGVLTYFEPLTKVEPYKKCEVILHE